jgi:very-short-patch-repair endonuclease
VSPDQLRAAVRGRYVVRLAPTVYALASLQRDEVVREQAAVLYAGRQAALSHTSALRRWAIFPANADGCGQLSRVHVVVPVRQRVRGTTWLAVHRREGVPAPVLRGGLPVTSVETTVVDCWALLSGPTRRAIVLEAVSSRRTTVARLTVAADVPNLRGRRDLLDLLGLIAAGCRSELEVWGYLHVFSHPSLPRAERQYRITHGRRVVYLDVAFPEFRVGVELDGAAFHGSREARERDLRRDTWLAARGWVVLRFSHARLTSEPAAVRAEVAAVLASRGRRSGAS